MILPMLGVVSEANAHNHIHADINSQSLGISVENIATFHSTSERLPATYRFSGKSSAFDVNLKNQTSYDLPDLGRGGGRFIEENKHKALGEWSLSQLYGSVPVVKDPWSQGMLETLAWKINAQARQQAPLALVVINNSSINAFAIPGGVMGLNTGTVIESHSIDEVASVVAHEVAHLSQRHYEHRDSANKKALMLQIGGVIAALAASAANGDAAAAIMMGSQTAAIDSQMAFSRRNEREADRVGMHLMAKSGYDPRAMPRFFATLNKKTQLNMGSQMVLPSFIMTHPLSSERLSEAQSRANAYEPISSLHKRQNQVDFDLLKWRLKVMTKQANIAELKSGAKTSQGAALALAYLYATQGRYAEANDIFTALQKTLTADMAFDKYDNESTAETLLAITQAQVAGMQGKWQQSETLLRPYYQLYPERRDIRLYLTDALLQLGDYQEAVTLLKPLIKNRPHDIEALSRMQHTYEAMAKSAHSNKDINNSSSDILLAEIATINAFRYRAKVELWQAQYKDALASLEQAKALIADAKGERKTLHNSFTIKPLLASINHDIAEVKIARDFSP